MHASQIEGCIVEHRVEKSQLKHIRDEQMTDGKVISIAECLHVTLAKNRNRLIIICCRPIISFPAIHTEQVGYNGV